MLQRTTVTVPEEAAWIGVPRGAPRSTPSWPGRAGVRKPDTIGARTGATQPIGPTSAEQSATAPVSADTRTAASGSRVAYASGNALFCTAWAASVNAIVCQPGTFSSAWKNAVAA
jgi:hypothetical protein